MKRETIQRRLVLDAVRATRLHPTADDVLAQVRGRFPRISRATVYNNLNRLCGEGEIVKLDYPGEPERFDARTGPHTHFRCDRCGRVLDFPAEVKIEPHFSADAGFDIKGCDVFFHGLCEKCRALTRSGPLEAGGNKNREG